MTSAIYVRVSTDRQALAQTIDQQIERLRRHLENEGQELHAEHICRDDGSSGATLNRPGLDRRRDQLREGDIERVLIASPDRLARNYVHHMVLLEEFARYGCQVDFRLCRKFCSGGHEGAVAPVWVGITRPESRTIRPQ
jgi:site-specific DNA recombinase